MRQLFAKKIFENLPIHSKKTEL